MILYVVRHGETDLNSQERYGGQMNVPLNETGLKQAKILAEKIKEIEFDIMISSPLLRAVQTAQVISEMCDIPYSINKSFIERNLGVYEGLTNQEIQFQYPDLFVRNVTRQIDDAPTGGETIRQFDNRILEAVKQLKNQYPCHNVLLITHGFVIRHIHRIVNHLSYDEMYDFKIANTEIKKYQL